MKKSNVIVVLCVLVSGIVFSAGGDMGAGTEPLTDGSQVYPYLIEDLADFLVFSGDSSYWASGVHTRLETNIDLAPSLPGRQTYTNAVIAPDTDGDTPYSFDGTAFNGIFDGGGHTISNLSIDTAGVGNDYLGLFGYIDGYANGAEVKNLRLADFIIHAWHPTMPMFLPGEECSYIGGICGYNNSGTIKNCDVNGSMIAGTSSADNAEIHGFGGISGCNFVGGTIENCSSKILVTVAWSQTTSNHESFGGLCGVNDGIISNCNSAGSIAAFNSLVRQTASLIGGLCGNNSGDIDNSYSTATVSGRAQIGGLCGNQDDSGNISNCYSLGSVKGTNSVGGLCGTSNYNSIINNCYSTGNVAGMGLVNGCCPGTSDAIGGLCGFNGSLSAINNCYSSSVVTGTGLVGGLCGLNYGNISSCYSTGPVTATGVSDIAYEGGFCGASQFGTITNCFWNIETSGTSDGVGDLTPDPAGIMGKNTSDMQIEATFADTPTNWDFVSTWWINGGRDYPKLNWQPFGDLNNDSHVNLYDLAVMSMAWQTSDGDGNYNSVCEISGDTTVNISDLIELVSFWLSGPSW